MFQRRRLLIAAGLVLIGVAPAVAAEDAKTVPAQLLIESRQEARNHCETRVIARWRALPNEAGPVVVKAIWRGREFTYPSSPPYDDRHVTARGTDWSAPTGFHQRVLSAGSGDSPNPEISADCGPQLSRLRERWTSATVEVQLKKDAKIVGRVTDTDGDPVSGVTVRARGAGAARTDADGDYEIDVPERTRTYVVQPRFRDADFLPRRRSVAIRAGQTRRANFRMRFERAISGTVRSGCKGQQACSVLPVEDVNIRATRIGSGPGPRRYSATTREDGTFKLRVKRARYRVETTNAVMDVTPRRRTVNLRSARKRTANYTACGLKDAGGQTANAIEGGIWRTPVACRYDIGISWRPENQNRRLAYFWRNVIQCAFNGRPVLQNRIWAVDRHWQELNLLATPQAVLRSFENKVVFGIPLVPVRVIGQGDKVSSSGPPDGQSAAQLTPPELPLYGELLADGTGTVNGRLEVRHQGEICALDTGAVPLVVRKGDRNRLPPGLRPR